MRGLAPQVGQYTLGGAGDSLLRGRSSCVLSKDTYDSFVEDLLNSRLLINIFQKTVLARQPSRAADSSPPLLVEGGMGTPPVYWQAGGGGLYI